MSYVVVQDLLVKTDSIYKLVILAARRAREINAGAPRLVEFDNANSASAANIALQEILQDRVKLKT